MRCRAEKDTTPYRPIAASTSAKPANVPESASRNLVGAMASVTQDSSVDRSATGTSLSIALTSVRICGIRLVGSRAVRTTKVIGKNDWKT